MNCSNVSPYGLQLFKHCSSMGPFLLVHFFRSSLLQHGFPTGLQVLPEDLQCGLLCMSHSFCQRTALSWAPHGLHSTSTNSGVFHSGDICSTMVFSMGFRGLSAPASGTLFSPLFFSQVLHNICYSFLSYHRDTTRVADRFNFGHVYSVVG